MKISFCFRRNIVFLHLPNCLVDLAHPPLDSWGNNENSDRLFWGGGGAPKSLQMVTAAMKLKDAYSLEEKL